MTIGSNARTLESAAPAAVGQGVRWLFFGRVIAVLACGASFRTYLSRFLKIAAAGIAFAGFVALFNVWQFTARQEASGIIGGVAYMFFLVAGFYMVAHAFVLRAERIASLPDGEFALIPICGILALLAGEAFAAFSASLSVGGGVLIWFAPRGAFRVLQDVATFVPTADGADFLGGVLFMIRGLVGAVAALIAGYLVSELLCVAGRVGQRAAASEKD